MLRSTIKEDKYNKLGRFLIIIWSTLLLQKVMKENERECRQKRNVIKRNKKIIRKKSSGRIKKYWI